MSPHPRPLHAAERRYLRLVVGDERGVAEGVPIAVRPDPQTNDGHRPRAVLGLVSARNEHRDTCPQLANAMEGGKAV
ncbi:hypothetical protein [Streptomyces sp. NPDC048527]|uniref:hypothetical protein n=1 Tax=Streptomyces sp. NPDC048527 TaxID=3365568 RepID=UPI003719FC06